MPDVEFIMIENKLILAGPVGTKVPVLGKVRNYVVSAGTGTGSMCQISRQ